MTGLDRQPPEVDPGDPPDGSAGVAAASATGAFWTLVSRATGFVRVAVVAAALGATFLANTYGATNYLPNLALELVAGSVLGSLLVPPLVHALDRGGREKAERLAGAYLGLVLLVFTIVAVVVALAGPLILQLFSAGISDRETAGDQQRVGWILLALQVWQIPLYAVVQVAVAAQTARGKFALAAGAPAIENIGIMGVMVAYVLIYGTGGSIGDVQTGQLLLLGGGSTLAVGAHAAVQWWGARRVGVTLIPRRDWRTPEVRDLMTRARLAFRLSALTSGRTFGALAVANTVAGGVVAFQIGLNFMWLPAAIGARPVAIALQPVLARLHLRGAVERFREEFVRGISVVLFMAVPAAAGYVVLAEPLAEVVAYGEFDTGAGVALMVATIVGLGLGVIGDSGFILGTYASFARDDARSPYSAMAVGATVAVAGMTAAALLFEGADRLLALGAAYSASTTVAAWRLSRNVGGRSHSRPRDVRGAALRAIGAAGLMAGPAYLLAVVLPAEDIGRGGQLLTLASAALASGVVYVAAQRAWRSPELDFFLSVGIGARLRRRRGNSS